MCAVALCLLAGRAAAHNFPTPFRLLFAAHDPDRIVVLLRPGLALTTDGGRGWSYLCGAITGIAGDEAYPAVLAGNRLLVGGYVGLYGDDGAGCGWARLEGGQLPAGRVVSLFANDDGSVEALVAPTSSGAGLFVSQDLGRTWSQRGLPLPAAMPSSAARAPSEPTLLYVVGSPPMAAGTELWASDDAGERWSKRGQLEAGCREIVAVDPTDPRRLFVRCESDELDRVLVSTDGGETFALWAELPDVGGLAIAPDGSSVWVGSRAGGLWRADGDGPLQQLHEHLHVGCVQLEGDTLWICTRDDRGFDAYALAISRDRGETLSPFLFSTQVARLRTCGDPEQAATCNSEWNQWQADVYQAKPSLDAAAAAETPDASVPPSDASPPSTAASRASCTVRAGRGDAPLCCSGLLAGLAWLVRRRARRR